MNSTNVIAKSLKVTFPQNVYILPFDGNLTENRKNELATRLKKHINEEENRNVSIEDVQKVIWHNFYGRIEKDLTIEADGERNTLRGQGWSCCNMPKEQLVVLH